MHIYNSYVISGALRTRLLRETYVQIYNGV